MNVDMGQVNNLAPPKKQTKTLMSLDEYYKTLENQIVAKPVSYFIDNDKPNDLIFTEEDIHKVAQFPWTKLFRSILYEHKITWRYFDQCMSEYVQQFHLTSEEGSGAKGNYKKEIKSERISNKKFNTLLEWVFGYTIVDIAATLEDNKSAKRYTHSLSGIQLIDRTLVDTTKPLMILDPNMSK